MLVGHIESAYHMMFSLTRSMDNAGDLVQEAGLKASGGF